MKRLLIFATLFLLPSIVQAQCSGVTSCTAASGNPTDVQTALNSVNLSGTTLTIPAGTWTWTGTTSYTISVANLTVKGVGNLNCPTSCDDQTIIIDNITRNSGTCSPDPATMDFTTGSASTVFRLSGFTYQKPTAGVTTCNGNFRFHGFSQNVRVDHIHISTVKNEDSMRFLGWIYGVVDHLLIDQTGTAAAIFVEMPDYSNTSNSEGDGGWADNTNAGSIKNIFIEDTVFNHGIYGDCNHGGKMVARHNTFNFGAALQTHPTGGGGTNSRGCRSSEIYQNTFNGDPGCATNFSLCESNAEFMSSGTLFMFKNSCPVMAGGGGCGYQRLITLHSMRRNNSTYPETPTPNGWGFCGTDSGLSGAGSAWDQNSNTSTGYACLDEPGRGKGDLLTGEVPNKINSVSGIISWPRQALEPVYEWLDTFTQVPNNPGGILSITETGLLQNQDIYIYTQTSGDGVTWSGPAFNGTVGTGSGLLSARPATCTAGPGGNTPGVGYWATDTNILYVCNPTNTWTVYYTPFIYPHPLVGAAAPAPLAPSSLMFIGGYL